MTNIDNKEIVNGTDVNATEPTTKTENVEKVENALKNDENLTSAIDKEKIEKLEMELTREKANIETYKRVIKEQTEIINSYKNMLKTTNTEKEKKFTFNV